MKFLNRIFLVISTVLITSTPVLAHIGGHKMGLYEAAIHFLSNPVHIGFIIVGIISVVGVSAYRAKIHARVKLK